jgi:hypothetical protein
MLIKNIVSLLGYHLVRSCYIVKDLFLAGAEAYYNYKCKDEFREKEEKDIPANYR